jgi:hypothetical protein
MHVMKRIASYALLPCRLLVLWLERAQQKRERCTGLGRIRKQIRKLRGYQTEQEFYLSNLKGKAFWCWAGKLMTAVCHAELNMMRKAWAELVEGATRYSNPTSFESDKLLAVECLSEVLAMVGCSEHSWKLGVEEEQHNFMAPSPIITASRAVLNMKPWLSLLFRTN